jgi:O-antigen ligase
MTSGGATAPVSSTWAFRSARFSLYTIGLMWLLPFLQPVHRYPLSSFRSEWIALVLGMVALAPLARHSAPNAFRAPVITLFPLAFILVLIAQAALGMLPYVAQLLTPALYLIWAGFLIVVAHDLKKTLGLEEIAMTLAGFLLVGGLLSALAGYAQHFDVYGTFGGLVSRKTVQEVYGNLAQRNHFANYVVLALVSLVYLFARRFIRLRTLIGCALFMLPALALSGSRSIWLYLAVLLAMSGSVRVCSGASERRKIAGALVGLTAMFVAAQWLVSLPFFQAGSLVPLGERLFEAGASGSIRLQLWREALAMFLQSPWLGVGFGNFAWQHFLQQAQGPVEVVDGLFNNAHNVVLHALAETGLAGFAVIATGVVVWASGVLRSPPAVEIWWMMSLAAVIGVHSFLEFPLWYAYFLGIFAVVVGLGSARAFPMKIASAGRWVVMGALAAGGINAVAVLDGYLDLERAVAVRVLESPEEKDRHRRAFVDASRDPLLEPYADFGLSAAIEAAPENLGGKLHFNKRVMRLAPTARVVYTQAILLALNGDAADARRLFRRAMTVYRDHLPPTINALQSLSRRYPDRVGALLELALSEKGSR